jgi:hypothetical protein
LLTSHQGSQILSTVLSLPTFDSIHIFSRRDPTSTPPKLHSTISSDTTTWPTSLSTLSPTPSIFFSALGTTAKQAGGFANQKKIDYDLNLSLAKAAKASGVKIYVLISTVGASPTSPWGPFLKMKGELDEAIKEIGFEHTVFLKPGLLVGTREDSRPSEYVLRKVAGFVGMFSTGLKDAWAQDAEVIGRAAVAAGLQALENKEGKVPRVWEVLQADIVRLGRTEWKPVTES